MNCGGRFTVTFGEFPTPIIVPISRGAQFATTADYEVDGVATPWPSAPRFSFPQLGVTWTSTLNGSDALFNQSPAATSLITDYAIVELWLGSTLLGLGRAVLSGYVTPDMPPGIPYPSDALFPSDTFYPS